MLLRSITKHVKDQNWFAVFLDFFIVVFGVFMGFQVQQWNENRKNTANAHEYLERLLTDMELSITRNEYQALQSSKHIESYDFILNALQLCELEPSKQPLFAAGLYNLGKYDMPAMVMSTIDELNATGNFPLINDLELRRQISESVRKQETIVAIDNQITARVVPSINYVRTLVRFNLNTHISSPSEIDPKFVIYNFDKVCVDQKFINAIGTVREMTLATISFNQSRRDDQMVIVDKLKDNLGIQKQNKNN